MPVFRRETGGQRDFLVTTLQTNSNPDGASAIRLSARLRSRAKTRNSIRYASDD
jgi:hypothetical protein